jgi:hypothetical protein
MESYKFLLVFTIINLFPLHPVDQRISLNVDPAFDDGIHFPLNSFGGSRTIGIPCTIMQPSMLSRSNMGQPWLGLEEAGKNNALLSFSQGFGSKGSLHDEMVEDRVKKLGIHNPILRAVLGTSESSLGITMYILPPAPLGPFTASASLQHRS